MVDKNLYNELKERGLLYQCSDEDALKRKLESGEPLVVYEGSDPTADSLHIGHCVPYCILRRFQRAGHKVILLMGGATACIGDPSGKDAVRKMLTFDEVNVLIGHEIGGVCPFAINENVDVYLDESLKSFDTVFPACGSSNSAIELTMEELEKYSLFKEWVDVCKLKE